MGPLECGRFERQRRRINRGQRRGELDPLHRALGPANLLHRRGGRLQPGLRDRRASVIPPAGSTPAVSDDSVTFFITAPTIAVGISPASAGVSLNAAQQFTGYAVGSVNNALTWQVDGVNGGSVAYGTITAAGLYTAPPILPMTGAGVTITVLSQADPTKSASALVNLQ